MNKHTSNSSLSKNKIFRNVSILLGFAFITLNACNAPTNQNQKAATNGTLKVAAPNSNTLDYESFKKSIVDQKEVATASKLPEILYDALSINIFNYWKGTPWDFNGTTQIPQKGNIACGYFVTNTLTDLGFKIKRIKLAQVVSSEMINTLCVDIHRFSKIDQLQTYLDQQPDKTAFIIGLDFHTGYILKDASGSYFMHSNYIGNEGVIKEKILSSKALNSSKSFVIGNLSGNKNLLQNWKKD